MKRLLAALVAVLALAGCVRHPDGTRGTQASPVPIFLVGDSLTMEYGPPFHDTALKNAAWVEMRYAAGTSPCDTDWVSWITAAPQPRYDYVIIEDFGIVGFDLPCTTEEYLAAFQQVVDAAHVKATKVIVLDGVHPDLSTITGIDLVLPMEPADAADGIHWSPAGAQREATKLCLQLSGGDGC